MGIFDTAFNLIKAPFEYGHDLVKAYTGISGVEAQKQANEYNLQATRETNELNKQLYYDQKAENRYLREQEMQYDSAAAQYQRLKDAGLNPILAMYQGVNAGSVGASSAPSPTPMQAPHMNPVDYSPMASAIGNTMSLLQMVNPVAESLSNSLFAGSRAAASASSVKSKAAIDKNNEALSGLQVDYQKKANAIVEQELRQKTFDAIMADLKIDIVTANQDKFRESLLAEWEQKVRDLKLTKKKESLTDEEIKRTFQEALSIELENEGLSKLKMKLWSILGNFLESHIDKLRQIASKAGTKSASIWDYILR